MTAVQTTTNVIKNHANFAQLPEPYCQSLPMATNKSTMNNTELLLATRYYNKEQGVTKTCQTCKHWIPDTVRNGKSLSASMGKCKEIFRKLTTFDSEIESHIPFLESFVTESTFGCNGYEQAKSSL
jgi:hypothetical protein